MDKKYALIVFTGILIAAILASGAFLLGNMLKNGEDTSVPEAESSTAAPDDTTAPDSTGDTGVISGDVSDTPSDTTAGASDTSSKAADTSAPNADTTAGSSETTASSSGTTKAADTTSKPDVTTKPAETTATPIVTTKPADTTSKPSETTKPTETTATPVVTTKPAETTATPSDTTAPAETTSKPADTTAPAETTSKPADTTAPAETTAPADPDTEPVSPDGKLSVTYVSGTKNAWTFANNVLTFGKISGDSVYAISGTLDGNVVIDVGEDYKFELDLAGITINSASASPITVISADKVEISAQNGTLNVINDNRAAVTDDSDYSASVWADCDMTLKGKGSLTLISKNNNGVYSKNDLTVKNLTLSVTCIDDALKGKSSVTVESGSLTLIATGGDCIKTTSSEISSKGNQKGTVAILGGTVNVYAACDGISGAYNVEVSGDSTVLNIFTDKYSEYTGTVKTSSSSEMYLRVTSSLYSSSYRYAVMFYNSSEDYVWKDASYSGTQSSSGSQRTMGSRSSTYYIYKLDLPSGYTNFKVFRFSSTQTENSSTSYNACTSGGTINTARDMYSISSIKSSTITGSWTNYSSSGSGQSANEYSTKGIKAENEIIISGGTVTVQSNDDAIHATGYETLENKAQGAGNVRISGGTLTLTSLDDAIHADAVLYISGGNVTVKTAYEGLEGNGIEISGGTIDIYATDDGVNAAGSNLTPYVTVSGGSMTVLTGSGDTDGIDSNGTYTQTGGYVFTRSKTNDTSGNASGLDLDGSCKVTGGTLVVAGTSASTPASGSVCWVKFGSSGGSGMFGPGRGGSTSSVSFAAGTWTVKDSSGNVICTFTLDSTCSGLWIASESFTIGSSYTLTNGTTTKSWTQSSTSVTAS